MHILLDTQIFISLINKENNLEEKVIEAIEKSDNQIAISIISLWEIIIKVNIGKLKVTRNLDEMYKLIEQSDISIINVNKRHLEKYVELLLIHRDPFDRMIISQAIADDLTIITDDQYIRNYPNLKLF